MLALLTLLADPLSVWGAEISSLMPLSSSQVKMVSEKVSITLTQDSAIVQASYVFVNPGSAVKIQVAFPKQASMRGFVAKSNGKKLKVSEGRFLYQEIYQDSTLSLPEGFDVAKEVLSWFGDNPWFVHQLSFGKGETLRLTHSYTVSVASDSHIYGYKEFRYYLRTGSLWAGVPKSIEVEVRVDRVPAACFCGFGSPPIRPINYIVSGDTLRWAWTDWEPDQDIAVVFREPDAIWVGGGIAREAGILLDGRPETGISLARGDSFLLIVGNPQALSLYPERDPERNFIIIPRFLDSLYIEFAGLVSISNQGRLPSTIVPGAKCLLLCDTAYVMLGDLLSLPAMKGNPMSIKEAGGWGCVFSGKSGTRLPVIAVLIVAEIETGTLSEVKFYPNPTGFFGEEFWKENQGYFKGN